MAATFSRAVDPLSVTRSTLELRKSANVTVAATVTYDAAAKTATLRPANALAPLEWYTMRLVANAT
jgi:hypothetical protein